ncbi:MAG: sulfatase-like hydrolase/transferase [Polyangiales bacterium]
MDTLKPLEHELSDRALSTPDRAGDPTARRPGGERKRVITLESPEIEAFAASCDARFFVEEPGKPPRVVRVTPERPLRVGRGEDQDVALDDPSVSRVHAELTFEAHGVIVRDLGSSNGTWVGTARIYGAAKVPPGTLIRVGNTRLVPVPAETPRTVETSPAPRHKGRPGASAPTPLPTLRLATAAPNERAEASEPHADEATAADDVPEPEPLPLVEPPAEVSKTDWLGVVGAVLAGVITGVLDGLVASRQGLRGREVALAISHCIAANAMGAMLVGWLTQPVLTAAERIVPLRRLWRWARRGPKAWFARDPGLALRVALMFLGVVSAVGPVFPASRFVVDHLHSRTLMAVLITVVCALSIPFSALVVTLAAAPVSAFMERVGTAASAGAVVLVSLAALLLGATAFWEFNTEWLASLQWDTVAVFAVFPLVYAATLASLGVARERAGVALSPRVPIVACAMVVFATVASGFTLDRHQPVASAVLTHSATTSVVARTLRGVLDADADGASPLFNGGDCDDDDPTVNPSAFDVPNNGIDENCTGADARAWRGEGDGVFSADTGLGPETRPSFLLVTIDTLRPDHLGAYGYARPTSPNLDAFARGAVRFERAYTTAPRTILALASLWTGRYPSRVAWGPDVSRPSLLARNTTLAETLGDHGYRTAAFTDTDYFEDVPGLLQGFGEQVRGDRFKGDGDRAVEAATAWMRRRSDEGADIFAWVHLLEPHWPYRDRTAPRDFGHENVDLYDEEVAGADALFGRLLAAADAWNARNPARPLVVIVTADHGEGIGAHGFATHGYDMHEEAMRIPLLVRAPGVTPGVRSTFVSLIDLPVTVLNYARLRPVTSLSGRSLVELLRAPVRPGVARPWREELFAELQFSFEERQEPRVLYAPPYKLLWDTRSGTWELYDIVRDPREAHNLFDERCDVASRMRERLNAWAVGAPVFIGAR